MLDKKPLTFQLGFTLVEVTIVIAVIGILASIAVPNYQEYTHEAADNACLAEAQVYAQAVSIVIMTNKLTTPTHTASACRQITTPSKTATSLQATPSKTGTGIIISCGLTNNGICTKS